MTPAIDITFGLITIAVILWLGVLAIVLGTCKSAALGDRALLASRESDPVAPAVPARMRLGVGQLRHSGGAARAARSG